MDTQTLKKMEEQSKRSFLHPTQEMTDYRDTWRIFRVMAELVEGYNFLSTLEREVTILGSARFADGHKYNKIARELGSLLGKNGFTTITGGGPGIMEAANRGAYEVGGESVGLNIQLPFEQRINPYVKKSAAFYYFFTRKVMLTSPANAFVFFPGGFGTLDEFFEVVDLMELGMLPITPIVLVGSDYWQPIIEFLKIQCCAIGSVDQSIVDSWQVVDTAAGAFDIIKDVKDAMPACDLSPSNFHCEGNVDWKIFQVMAELVEGFEFVTGLSHAVSIFGTKTLTAEHTYYDTAYELGAAIAASGHAVVTGGKSGIAEAASKGAFESGGMAIGIGMKVKGAKSDLNSYLTKSILFQFPFTRKLIMTAPTEAFVFFPGGFGSLHQLFEVLTLIQTKKLPRIPVILYDYNFWSPLHDFIKKVLVHDVETIGDQDDELYQMVGDTKGVMKIIEEDDVH